MIRKLFHPVDIASLVFFRLVFGILGFVDVFNTYAYYHLMESAYDPANFQFYYFGFAWVKVFPEPFMSLFFALILASSLAIIVGWRYRIAAAVFFLGFTYIFLLEKAHYLNHGYLFCWVAFVMIFLPADRAYSLAVLKRPGYYRKFIPAWSIFVLPFLMSVVYIFGGIAKINPDWLRGVPLVFWVQSSHEIPVLGILMRQDWMPLFLSYGGLLFDLSIVPLMINRRSRKWAFLFAVFFHGLNLLLFNIGIFPYLSLALTALFFPPDFPRKVYAWLNARLKVIGRIGSFWRSKWQAAPANRGHTTEKHLTWQEEPKLRGMILAGLFCLAAVHIALPLRHHFFPGDVAWTEEGHRYAWRMMLRSKSGYGSFFVVNRSTGDTIRIRPGDHLQDKQSRKLFTHPDMILAYAHYLHDAYSDSLNAPVAVYADIKVRLNDGDYGPMVDPEVDLGTLPWEFFSHSIWISEEPPGHSASLKE